MAKNITLIFRPFKGLSTIQSAILSLVVSFQSDKKLTKTFRMTNATIGKMLGVKPVTAKAAIRVLRRKGYVENYMRHSKGRTLIFKKGSVEVPDDFCHLSLPVNGNLKLLIVLATISQYDKDLMGNSGQMPTLKLIMQKTGLSDKTARRYLKQILSARRHYEECKKEAEADKLIWKEIHRQDEQAYRDELWEINKDHNLFPLDKGDDPDSYVKDQFGNYVYRSNYEDSTEETMLKYHPEYEREMVTDQHNTSFWAIRSKDPVQHKIEPPIFPEREQEVSFEVVANGYVYKGG